ncbi:DUF2242 domain-containing protein [Variovorax sp. LT2P21]|uniref:DUF2242 domain-containing protein n=1 Tax=Variovorax sp. LT2P21 TaxID=3443731 RepID=UPI003F47CD27
MSPHSFRLSSRFASGRLAAALVLLVLAGCAGTSKRVVYDPEEFDSTTTHARGYAATEAQTCEAARRALLSQGYLITAANPDLVTGRKNFQPASEVHVEVEFRVVCARDQSAAKGQRKSIAFVTALQDRYGIKKTNNAASVGVGVIGSLSLPFSSSDDAMVKVASETLTDERFYDRFYALLDRYLVPGAVDEKVEEPSPPVSMPGPAVITPVVPQSAPVTVPLSPPPVPVGTPVEPSPNRG